MLLTILRCSLFVVSLYGYTLFFRRKGQLHPKLSWVAACCFTILVLYAAAFIGLLFPAALFLFVAGIGLVVYYDYGDYRKGVYRRPRFHLSMVWLGGYILVFVTTLLQSHLEHYDNYTYWVRIVKFFFTEGQLPTAASTLIEYPSYPIASSLFVYYSAVIGGFADNVMLLGQFIFIMACIYALFAVLRDQAQFLLTAILFTGIAAFNYYNIAIRMNNLLVDFLIPVLTLAGIAGVYCMRKQVKAMSLYVFLTASVLTMLKSSAAFFTIVLLLYYAYTVYRSSDQSLTSRGQRLRYILATAAASWLPYLIWRIHVSMTFTATKHDASISSLSQGISEKSGAVIQEITGKYLGTIFNLQTLSTQGILLINAILLLAYFGFKRLAGRETRLLRCTVLIDAIILLYYIGIYAMFLFSMPTNEAIYLAGFDRYASSIVILALGLAVMILVQEVDYGFYEQEVANRSYRSFKNPLTKAFYQYSTAALLFLATMLTMSEINGMNYNNANFNRSVPAKYQKVVGNNMTLNDKKYLVVTSDADGVSSYLVQHVGKYFLYSINVDARVDFDQMSDDEFRELFNYYDTIVVLDENAEFNARTEQLYQKTLTPGKHASKVVTGQRWVQD